MANRIEKLLGFLQETPNDCFLNHALALEFVKLDDDGTARGYFEKNLEYDPTYIATYYHLAKLYERQNEIDDAVTTYEQGMDYARKAGDNHSYSELQNALEELTD